jgi:CheY-like chemotaxis protein
MPSIELERVVTNLVGNALKHSRGSRVVLEVREQAGGIRISVSDNGEGFPQDVLTCFASDSERLPSAGDGWGLGLLTSKQRIKDAGGAMTVASLPGAGSIVVISLPRNSYGVVEQPAVLELRDQVPQIAAVQQQKELVLVDDDEEHSASLSRILSKYGIKVRSFSSVEAIAPELSNGEISAIVCDINMPDGGAEALLSRLRTTRCSASVAVISGESDDARLYRLAASGAQAFFGKPVQVEQLVEWVNSLEGDSARSCRYASNS